MSQVCIMPLNSHLHGSTQVWSSDKFRLNTDIKPHKNQHLKLLPNSVDKSTQIKVYPSGCIPIKAKLSNPNLVWNRLPCAAARSHLPISGNLMSLRFCSTGHIWMCWTGYWCNRGMVIKCPSTLQIIVVTNSIMSIFSLVLFFLQHTDKNIW